MLRLFLAYPHKQTLIDLKYLMEKLKENGQKVLILMDANKPTNHKRTT
jgi:predicted AAA+ superfamily ATPase